MDKFEKLGRTIDAEWSKVKYDVSQFPTVAEGCLLSTDLSGIDIQEVCDWVINSTDFVPQVNIDSGFGQPPLTVYSSDNFFIEVLFWLSATTSIHQHNFSGIFYVLSGSSIHTVFSFREEHKINDHLSFGDLITEKIEFLNKGSHRKILPGNSFIHSLFHLDHPSASLVIRTFEDKLKPIQYEYHRPHVAINSFYNNQRLRRQLEILRMMKVSANPNFLKSLNEFAEQCDLHSFIEVNKNLALENLLTNDAIENLLTIARRKHGQFINFIAPLFAEIDRVNSIRIGRISITQPDHRFFMALLMNAENRKHVDQIIRQRYPQEEPANLVTNWIHDLNKEQKFNPPFAEFQLELISLMLRSQSHEEAINSLKSIYNDDQIEHSKSDILNIYTKMKALPILKVLF